ncbi:hypothetical protein ANO14919_137510 [Xylariales sp. No.14919]|nr:hypothetical protein ANO14919_137510 [Xylariales sp. No.14919]
MAAAFDAQERTVAELKALFQDADPAFTLRTLIEPAGSALGILEFVWDGSVSQDVV